MFKSKGRSGKGLLDKRLKQQNHKKMKELLSVESGGIVFTTMGIRT
ncbi:hypothetical protein ACVPOY_02650 [Staphylococcus aureus]